VTHNLHILIVDANSKEEARNYVAANLDNFGDENNYWRYVGVFKKEPSESWGEIEGFFTEWFRSVENSKGETRALMTKYLEEGELSSSDTYVLKTNLADQLEVAKFKNKKLDIWKDEIYPTFYDKFGITNYIYGDVEDEVFMVVIDMHS